MRRGRARCGDAAARASAAAPAGGATPTCLAGPGAAACSWQGAQRGPPPPPGRHAPPLFQEELIQSEFSEPGSLQRAVDLVVSSGGVDAARRLAREEADKALAALAVLPASRAKRSLELMVDYVLDRIY